MAHIGCESGITSDAALHGIGHVVERLHDHGEVGIVAALDACVETAVSNRIRSVGDGRKRSQQPPASPCPNCHADQNHERCSDTQDEAQACEGGLDLRERDNFEIQRLAELGNR